MSATAPDTPTAAADWRWHPPLAERMRPRAPQDLLGQEHLLAAGKPLARMLGGGPPHSMVLWGPPGSGKTTMARMLGALPQVAMRSLSAVSSRVGDIRAAVDEAERVQSEGRRLLLFVDEVHRFNKAQQDAFLPPLEDGTIVLVGATTENPSFELTRALLSRLRVYVLNPMDAAALRQVLAAAVTDAERGLGPLGLQPEDEALDLLAQAARGDARRGLGLLEGAAQAACAAGERTITAAHARAVLTDPTVAYDKGGDQFYDLISAMHKSVRGSDPDAAAFWAQRMLRGGCHPGYILRRLVCIASEDIGNADPRALTLALDAWRAYERLGPAEGELAITHAAIYLAVAAKSNAVYRAHGAAATAVAAHPDAAVPPHLRNAPTALARGLGHGKHYRYPHDEDGYAAGERYLPEELADASFYHPTPRGLEGKIGEKLAHLRQLDAAAAAATPRGARRSEH